MIKFFQVIRKKLISESGFRKYSLYAFGEIVLVMIGILLALQVNNWNEDRKNKDKEHPISVSLRSELQANLEELRNDH